MSWFSKKQRHGSVGESTKLDSSISSNETSQRQIFIQSYTEGACNPLDWEAMPLTLQMKFPHWKDQNFPSPTTRRKDAEERNLPSPPVKKGTHVPPINSIPYIVMQCDTLASIALKFDISQGEIARNNNIVLGGSCPIYPGELLYIPDSSVVIEKTNSTENNNGKVATNNEGVDFKTESSSSLQEEQSLEEEVTTTHIQIISKFMSDQLCVLGTLMINKQSLMFRPSLNDPLVEEQGVAAYEVLIPLSEIVYAYITLNYTPPENSMFASPSPINEESPLHSHSPQLKPDLNPSPSNENTKDVANNETHSELDPINLDLVNEETNEEKNQKLEDSGEKEKKLESSDEGEYGDDPRSLAGPWRFLYVRVSQSSQQNSSAPVIGIEIPNSNARETAVQSVRTWFIFAVPTVRLKDIHSFLCTHHPMSQSADNIASDIESSLTSNNKLEIINLRGQYSDDSLPVFERHYSSSWEIFSVRDVQPIRLAIFRNHYITH